jgi:hypothetical protein
MNKILLKTLLLVTCSTTFAQSSVNQSGLSPAETQAYSEAESVIKQVIDIHRCLKPTGNYYNDQQQLTRLNPISMPGMDARVMGMYGSIDNMAPLYKFQYATKTRCVDVRQIDSVQMPALNVLSMRVIYMASDSGETKAYRYEFQKDTDHQWKLRKHDQGL